MINMNHIVVVTPLSIYHGCSTRKTFWEEKYTIGEFSALNMKNGGCRNVRKHREIKVSYKYVTLDISLKFGILDKMRIKSSETKDNFGKIREGVDYLSGSQGQKQVQINKKSRYAIRNIIMKELSKIIREFEKSPYKSYESRRPKHDPTDSYF